MLRKDGSSLIGLMLTVAGVAAIGTAGYSMFSGSCATACGDKAACDSTAKVVQVANAKEAKGSCCELKALAGAQAGDPIVVAASATETKTCGSQAKACGANKSACSGERDADGRLVIQGQPATEEQIRQLFITQVPDRNAETMNLLRTESAGQKTCGSAASCGGGKLASRNHVVMPAVFASASDAAATCGDKAASSCCASKVAKGADVQPVAASSAKAEGCCKSMTKVASAAAKSCGDKAESCCKSGSKMASASRPMEYVLIGAAFPMAMPAEAFNASATIDYNSLTKVGCCRSGVSNASAKAECSEKSACCSAGKAVVQPAAATSEAKSGCCGDKAKSGCGDKAAEPIAANN